MIQVAMSRVVIVARGVCADANVWPSAVTCAGWNDEDDASSACDITWRGVWFYESALMCCAAGESSSELEAPITSWCSIFSMTIYSTFAVIAVFFFYKHQECRSATTDGERTNEDCSRISGALRQATQPLDWVTFTPLWRSILWIDASPFFFLCFLKCRVV